MECLSIPTPFEVAATNCYVLAGDELTVIDPGPRTTEAYRQLQQGLQAMGCSINSIDRILLTHPHVDHIGQAHRVEQEADAEVLAHRDSVDRLADPVGFLQRDVDLGSTLMEAHGVPPEVINSVPNLAAQFDQYQEPVTVDRGLEEGDHVDGENLLEVLYTPGHAPGSICFVSPHDDTVFTGDHVLQHVTPNPSLAHVPESPEKRIRSLPLYLESLKKLASIGVRRGYPGHEAEINDVPGRIEEILTHHDERKDEIAVFVESKDRTTAYHIMEHLFPDLALSQTLFGFAEVLGHLDLLELEDRIAIEKGDTSAAIVAS